jgi:nucleotide-binding universal stress UspA family protein
MKVLIGIDGSEHSFAAAALAGRLLAPGRDRIALYHSCDTISLAESVNPALHERACQAVSRVMLEEAQSRLPGALQADVETMVGDAPESQALVEAAERYGAEMIVVGARGLGRLEGLLLGSVSSSVVRSSQVPVLLVRTSGQTAAAQPLKLLLAYDQISGAQHADYLGKLTWPADASGRVVAVVESMQLSHLPDWIQKRARDADTEAMSQVWVREHQHELEEKQHELAAYVQKLPAPFHANPPLVVEGNPAEQLINLIDKEKPNLVVVGKAMKNFFDRWFVGSVSEKILAHANCSVLVIPAAETA